MLGHAADETSYLDRAIGNFLQGIDDQVATMQRAAGSGDTARLQAAAHKVAGAALNLGVTELGEGLPPDLDALRAYQREQFPARAS